MNLTQLQGELVAPFIKQSLPSKKISGRLRRDDQHILIYLSSFPHLKQAAMRLNSLRKHYKNALLKQSLKDLIGDKAYDSDKLDREMKAQKVTLIAPHKENRKSKPTLDVRELRRYKRRWIVERLFAWIQNFRRCKTSKSYLIYCLNIVQIKHISFFIGAVVAAKGEKVVTHRRQKYIVKTGLHFIVDINLQGITDTLQFYLVAVL